MQICSYSHKRCNVTIRAAHLGKSIEAQRHRLVDCVDTGQTCVHLCTQEHEYFTLKTLEQYFK